jgi:uncharacterized protein (DUF2147 family)
MKYVIATIGLLAMMPVLVPAASADPAVGIWQTQPDRKDLTSQIDVKPCGAALCGTVLRAFDAKGREVRTANVGKRLFWDMQAQGNGAYSGGTVEVASMNLRAKATMQLQGNSLRVTGCKGPACFGQTWTRMR